MLQCTNLVPTQCFCSGMVTFFALLSLSFSISPLKVQLYKAKTISKERELWMMSEVSLPINYCGVRAVSMIQETFGMYHFWMISITADQVNVPWDHCVAAETMFNFWQIKRRQNVISTFCKSELGNFGTFRKWSRKDIMQIWLRSGTNSSRAEIIHHAQKQSS